MLRNSQLPFYAFPGHTSVRRIPDQQHTTAPVSHDYNNNRWQNLLDGKAAAKMKMDNHSVTG